MTAQGELMFQIFGALAQFERSLIQERVRAGLAATARRGRRPVTIDAEKLGAVTAALDSGATQPIPSCQISLISPAGSPSTRRKARSSTWASTREDDDAFNGDDAATGRESHR